MQKKEFLMHLIGEMGNFILDENPSRMVISLHQEEDGIHLCIIDNNQRTEEEIEDIKKALNCQRRPEMAGYYGAMAGHDLVGHARLNLIGWQVKHGDVSSTDNGTKIDLWLGSDQFDHGKFNIPSK
ncbi:hypothetical protein KAJ27_05535 [bacterium]|nr:hypothetical protein [bacterium]